MEYTKHPLEDLSSDELAKVADYEHPFTDLIKQNIAVQFNAKTAVSKRTTPNKKTIPEKKTAPDKEIAAGEKPATRKKRSFRPLVAAIIAAAVLSATGVVFANFDRIQQLYNEYFGGDTGISKYAQEYGHSCMDQGIRMELITALSDGDTTYFFVELKDETGNRLSDSLSVAAWDFDFRQGNSGDALAASTSSSLVNYDPATGIATLAFEFEAIGGHLGNDAVITLSAFFTDRVKVDITADTLDLDKMLRENDGVLVPREDTGSLCAGSSQKFIEDGINLYTVDVLQQDALHIDIPGYEKGYISNIGYRDGRLHIQINPDNVIGDEGVLVNLKHKQTGKIIESYYSIGIGEWASEYGGITHIQSDYIETVFEINREDLKNYSLYIEGWYYNNIIEGNWQIGFQIPESMPVIIKSDIGISVNGQERMISTLEVSPLSVKMHFSGIEIDERNLEIFLIYKDGTRKTFVNHDYDAVISPPVYLPESFLPEDLNLVEMLAYPVYFQGPILDFENLAALEINGTRIALSDG
jgi:hypothetical protein